MTNWQQALGQVATNLEARFDALKARLTERLWGPDPYRILAYRGYGTQEKLYLKGRVLEDEGVREALDNDQLWDNLVNMYKRFETDEVAGARVRVRYHDATQEVLTNDEGFFEVWLHLTQPLPTDRLWHEVELELLEPVQAGQAPVRATGLVLVPQPGAQFGVISDMDDTVLQTDATNVLSMARTVFLGNARTRLPFAGVAALYQALQEGTQKQSSNPLFYVSSSPWNLYDLLSDFLGLQGIPVGPLFLRDWGVSREEILPTGHRSYKLQAIRQILDLYPELPFLLIGDSGQEDPEIYREVVDLYPQRIRAIYIRNVSHDLKRPAAVRALAAEVLKAGSTLLLADDTLAVARHTIEQGWIDPSRFPDIQAEKEADEPAGAESATSAAQQGAPEVVITADHPTQAEAETQAGAVEAALEATSDQPQAPSILVEGQATTPDENQSPAR